MELAALWWQAWSALALALALSAPPYEHLQELHALCSERRRRGGPVRRRRRSSALLVWPCNTTAPLHLLKPSMATSRPLAFFSSRVAGGTHAGDPQRDPAHMSNATPEGAVGAPTELGKQHHAAWWYHSHPKPSGGWQQWRSTQQCRTLPHGWFKIGFHPANTPKVRGQSKQGPCKVHEPVVTFSVPHPKATRAAPGDAKIGCQRPKEVGMKRPSMDRSSIRRDATQPLTYRR